MSHKITIFLFAFYLSACSISENESFEPAYLVLDNIQLTTKSNEGDARQNIKYAWLILDGQILGVFPVPGRIPIIPTGKNMAIQINAGVNLNGQINSSIEYPFFNSISKNMLIESGKDYNIDLSYTYKSDAVFDFVEGFENNTHLLGNDIDGNEATRINFTDKDKASGNKSGLLKLDNENQNGEFSCIPYFDNKNNKKGNVFLEFDYKSDETVFVGTDLQFFNSGSMQSYETFLPSTDKWTRAYINLSVDISQNNVDKYRVIFGATRSNNANPESEIYFDNVKLVHF